MELVIEIPEEEYNECKMQVEFMKQEGCMIDSLSTALRIHVANGKPLEDITMKHYRQGREDEKAFAEGRLMQAFDPD
jgi:type VI protein secretion system component Hcp